MLSFVSLAAPIQDGFEDGDYTNDPAWTKETTDLTAQVQSTDVKYGSNALQLSNPGDGTGRMGIVNSDVNATDWDSPVEFSYWTKSSDVTQTDHGGFRLRDDADTSVYIETRFRNGCAHVNAEGVFDCFYNNLNNDTWYKFKTTVYPSNDTFDVQLYDNSNNFLAELTGNPSGQNGDINNFQDSVYYTRDTSTSYNVYFDNVTYKNGSTDTGDGEESGGDTNDLPYFIDLQEEDNDLSEYTDGGDSGSASVSTDSYWGDYSVLTDDYNLILPMSKTGLNDTTSKIRFTTKWDGNAANHRFSTFQNGNYVIQQNLGSYIPGDSNWHNVTFDIDYSTDSYDILVDGTNEASDVAFMNTASAMDEVKIYGNNGPVYWDGVSDSTGSKVPSVKSTSPIDGATSVTQSTSLCATPQDSDDSSVDLTFLWSNSTVIQDTTTVSNNTQSCTNALSLSQGTTYDWYVRLNDGTNNITSKDFSFTTEVSTNDSIIADFENGYNGFTQETSGSGDPTITRSTKYAFEGSYSVRTNITGSNSVAEVERTDIDVSNSDWVKLRGLYTASEDYGNTKYNVTAGNGTQLKVGGLKYLGNANKWHTIEVNVSDVDIIDISFKASSGLDAASEQDAYWDYVIKDGAEVKVSDVECHDGSVWTSCSSLQFGDSLTKVRANISAPTDIQNTHVSVEDVYDENTRLNNFTNTSVSNNVFVFDFSDQTIDDSGEWNIEIYGETGSTSIIDTTTFDISWGTIQAELQSPSTDKTVLTGEEVSLDTSYSCTGGECVSEISSDNLTAYPDPPESTGDKFSWAVLPDTQELADAYPSRFDDQANFIANNYNDGNLDYAIHVGDIVNDGLNDAEWQNANQSISIIEDSGVPFGAVSGNHDIDYRDAGNTWSNVADYSKWNEYMPTDRFSSEPYYGGDFSSNYGNDYTNHYELHSFGNHEFVVVYMDAYNSNAYSWARNVFKDYPDRNGVLVTHEYLASSGGTFKDSQDYSTHFLNGVDIRNEVVQPSPNVVLTFNGHAWGDNRRQRFTSNQSHRNTWEIEADYSAKDPKGFMRYYNFIPGENGSLDMEARTYNPTEDSFDNSSSKKFTVTLDTEATQSDSTKNGIIEDCPSSDGLCVTSSTTGNPTVVNELTDGESFDAKWNVNATETGSYTLLSFANSTNENIGKPETSSISLSVQNAADPIISVENPDSNGIYGDTSVPLDVSSDQSISTWKYNIDGGTNNSFTPNTSVTGLSEGDRTLNVYGSNTNGTGAASVDFTVDVSAPTVSFNGGSTGSGEQNQGFVYTDVSSSDSITGVIEVVERFNGQNRTLTEVSSNNYAFNHTGLSDGSYTVEIWSTDAAGNTVYTSRDITLNTSGDSGGGDEGGDTGPEYIVENLAQGKAVGLTNDPTRDLTSNGVSGLNNAVFGDNTNSELAAELEIDFNNNVSAADFAFAANRSQGKAFLHNYSSISGLQTATLLVPRETGSGKLHVCPGAESLSAVNTSCQNGYNVSTGQMVNGVTVSEASISGSNYYRVEGITGTGAQEINTSTDDGGGFTGGGGGSGGSGSDDGDGDNTDTGSYTVKFSHTDLMSSAGETDSNEYIEIRNFDSQTNSVEIDVPSTGQCRYFSVQRQKGVGVSNLQEFGGTGSYVVEGNGSENYGALRVGVKVDMPNKTEIEGTSISCEPFVTVGNGQAEDLQITASTPQSFVDQVSGVLSGFGLPDTQFSVFQNVCTDPSQAVNDSGTCENGQDLAFSPATLLAQLILLVIGLIAVLFVLGLAAVGLRRLGIPLPI